MAKMKIPEDIRLLFIVLLTMGIVAGVAILAVIISPVISHYPHATVRIIIAVLMTFVTLKFFLYITEAVLLVMGRGKDKKPSPIKSAHPLLRALIIILITILAFVGYYFLIDYFKDIF